MRSRKCNKPLGLNYGGMKNDLCRFLRKTESKSPKGIENLMKAMVDTLNTENLILYVLLYFFLNAEKCCTEKKLYLMATLIIN